MLPEDRGKFKGEIEKRPIWSWEAGIFANIGEIGKWIDHHAMICEGGDMTSLYDWKASLKQFYRNIKSLLTESVKDTAERSFVEVDAIIESTSKSLPNYRDDIKKVMTILGNLNEMLYQARNELLIKVIERRNVDQELRDYMIPREVKDRGSDLDSQP